MGRRDDDARYAVNAELGSDLYMQLQAEAARRKISKSAIVRWALEAYFEHRDNGRERKAEAIA